MIESQGSAGDRPFTHRRIRLPVVQCWVVRLEGPTARVGIDKRRRRGWRRDVRLLDGVVEALLGLGRLETPGKLAG